MRKAVTFLFVFLGATGCSQQEDRACTPPLATWGKPHPHLGPGKETFTVSLDHEGALYFDGKKVSFNKLASQLQAIAPYDPRPAVILETEMGAPCQALDSVRTLMNEKLSCEKQGGGHCDEGVQTVWRDLPYTGPGVP